MGRWMLSGFGRVVNTDVSSSELASILPFSWVENAQFGHLELCADAFDGGSHGEALSRKPAF